MHSIEDPAAADGQALLHVQSASLLSMSLRSNTGFERSRELDDGTDANGGVHALSEREAHELPADNDEEDDDSEHSKDGNGEDAQRQERAQLFAQWAAKHFPHLVHESPQLSRRGNPPFALDVAGGRGELSLHLTLQGIYATLVDPRRQAATFRNGSARSCAAAAGRRSRWYTNSLAKPEEQAQACPASQSRLGDAS